MLSWILCAREIGETCNGEKPNPVNGMIMCFTNQSNQNAHLLKADTRHTHTQRTQLYKPQAGQGKAVKEVSYTKYKIAKIAKLKNYISCSASL